LQLEIGKLEGGRTNIFIDADNLSNLDFLMRTVRSKVDVLIVLVTHDIWWRPWCAGEITSASISGVPIVLVIMDDHDMAPLQLDFSSIAEQVAASISKRELEILSPYGIKRDHIETAYKALSAAPQVHFSSITLGRSMDDLSPYLI